MSKPSGPEATVREIRRKTRRKFSSEEKIRIVLDVRRLSLWDTNRLSLRDTFNG